jgi:hypothetical protein
MPVAEIGLDIEAFLTRVREEVSMQFARAKPESRREFLVPRDAEPSLAVFVCPN